MACPNGCIPGIDISHYQGAVDCVSAAAAGNQFLFAKATEGLGGADQTFARNWAAAGAAGMLRGAYHFLHPTDDGHAQANYFLQALTAANGSPELNPGDLPPALDIEVADGASAQQIINCATAWLSTVGAATGRMPVVYTFKSFWTTCVGHVPAFASYPLWIADPNPLPQPRLPATWTKWCIWQYGEQSVPWAGARVDLNAFTGAPQDLRALAGY